MPGRLACSAFARNRGRPACRGRGPGDGSCVYPPPLSYADEPLPRVRAECVSRFGAPHVYWVGCTGGQFLHRDRRLRSPSSHSLRATYVTWWRWCLDADVGGRRAATARPSEHRRTRGRTRCPPAARAPETCCRTCPQRGVWTIQLRVPAEGACADGHRCEPTAPIPISGGQRRWQQWNAP